MYFYKKTNLEYVVLFGKQMFLSQHINIVYNVQNHLTVMCAINIGISWAWPVYHVW